MVDFDLSFHLLSSCFLKLSVPLILSNCFLKFGAPLIWYSLYEVCRYSLAFSKCVELKSSDATNQSFILV